MLDLDILKKYKYFSDGKLEKKRYLSTLITDHHTPQSSLFIVIPSHCLQLEVINPPGERMTETELAENDVSLGKVKLDNN